MSLESSERAPKPDKAESENEKTQPETKKPAVTQKFPDWQPLGTVRDSFYEQIKQDERRY